MYKFTHISKDKEICKAYDLVHFRCLIPIEIVRRAHSKIGPLPYNVLWCNCEHFASWCRYCFEISEQVLYDDKKKKEMLHIFVRDIAQ